MKAASQIALSLAIMAAVAGGIALIVRLSPSDGGMHIILPDATTTPDVSLRVYVSGAVRNPGVYEFHEGDIVDDAIEAAGGVTEEAYMRYVNRAARLRDEDHWHIPEIGEDVSSEVISAVQRGGGSEKININSADIETLRSLPGIGDKKAQTIIDYREANGPFSSVEELANVRGIGDVTLDALRDLVDVR